MGKQVSIIVLTYNQDWIKLKRTLYTAVSQEDIDFEIIVSDDGSEISHMEEVKKYFSECGFEDYQLIENKKNMGTVKNLLGAVKASSGEYIYTTSPGDLLYDNDVMHDFYEFATMHRYAICFGNAIYYTPTESKIVSVKQAPERPSLFSADISWQRKKLAVFFDSIVGNSFFRRRDLFLKYLSEIVDVSKYVEDYTTSCMAVLDGTDIIYYDRNLTYYEYGVGISAEFNAEGAKKVQTDIFNTLKWLQKKYPQDAVLDLLISYKKKKSIWLKRLYKVLRHPQLAVDLYRNHQYPIQYSKASEEEMIQLKAIWNPKNR